MNKGKPAAKHPELRGRVAPAKPASKGGGDGATARDKQVDKRGVAARNKRMGMAKL
jgi:hypothetical protein